MGSQERCYQGFECLWKGTMGRPSQASPADTRLLLEHWSPSVMDLRWKAAICHHQKGREGTHGRAQESAKQSAVTPLCRMSVPRGSFMHCFCKRMERKRKCSQVCCGIKTPSPGSWDQKWEHCSMRWILASIRSPLKRAAFQRQWPPLAGRSGRLQTDKAGGWGK